MQIIISSKGGKWYWEITEDRERLAAKYSIGWPSPELALQDAMHWLDGHQRRTGTSI